MAWKSVPSFLSGYIKWRTTVLFVRSGIILVAMWTLNTDLSAQNYQLDHDNTTFVRPTVSYAPPPLLESRCGIGERYGLPSIPKFDHRVIARPGRDEREAIDSAKIRR